MAEPYSVRVSKFLTNPLLARKQFVLDVIHPGMPNVSRKQLKEKLAKKFKVPDANSIILFGFKTHFGGGQSTGFGLIYDSLESAKKFEKRYRLVRHGIAEAPAHTSRRARKELKNRKKKVRGKAKSKVLGGKQK